jgi:hypothetical protein
MAQPRNPVSNEHANNAFTKQACVNNFVPTYCNSQYSLDPYLFMEAETKE